MELNGIKAKEYLVLEVSGRMDALTAPQFEAACDEWLKASEKRMVVDMTALEYISSAGLRAILAVAKKLKAQGGELSFCALRGIVAEVFSVSGFAKLLPVFTTREEALARPEGA